MSDASPPEWVRDAVFYQIFPDRFARSPRVHQPGPLEAWDAPPTKHGFKGGDLLGVVDRLDYLTDLGINAIYLNPVFASAANHRYHTYDYLAVDPMLGGDGALRELLDEAHRRGMHVILDGVFNHSGRGFWPFHHVLENGAASPYRDWFHLNESWVADGRQLQAYPHRMVAGPTPDEASNGGIDDNGSLDTIGYGAWWDLPALPKLNVGNPGMREYLMQVAEHWIRAGADGWRLDVPEEIDDPEFWAEFRQRVRAVNPEAYLAAEIWRPAPEWLGAGRFDGLMNYPLAWAIIGFAFGDRLDADAIAEHPIMRDAVAPLDGTAFGTRVGELLDAYPAEQRAAQLNVLASHDTPRLLTVAGGDHQSVQLATLLQMAMPGAPCVYYGDEIGLAGGIDPACRGAFPWGDARWDAPLHDFVRRAIALRMAEPALRGDRFQVTAAKAGACAFERTDGRRTVLVVVNAGDEAVELPVPGGPAGADALLLTTEDQNVSGGVGAAGRGVLVPPRWGGVWSVTEPAA